MLQAGRRFGLTEEVIRANLATLQTLLPDMAPNLDRMKASDWVGDAGLDLPRCVSMT